jgi:hypothetical protein
MSSSEKIVLAGWILMFLGGFGVEIYYFWCGWRAWRHNKFPDSFGHRITLGLFLLIGGMRAAKYRDAQLHSPQMIRRLGLWGMIMASVGFILIIIILILVVLSLPK